MDSEQYKEYNTFTVKTKTGDDAELAVVDEFSFDGKDYVVGALILEDDTISEEGVYIYKASFDKEGNLVTQKIRDFDYPRVVQAYTELCEDEET